MRVYHQWTKEHQQSLCIDKEIVKSSNGQQQPYVYQYYSTHKPPCIIEGLYVSPIRQLIRLR
jgi:hypothetical protein